MKKFWMVVRIEDSIMQSPQSAPRLKHYDRDAAYAEAERLSRVNPGTRFAVLEAMACAEYQPVHWETAIDEEEMPF